MTKAYLDMARTKIVRLPKMSSRRNPGLAARMFHHGAQYASDGDLDPNDKRTEAELLAKIQTKITDGLATRASKEELEEIRRSIPAEFKDFPIEQLRLMADDKTGAMAMIGAQGLAIKKLQTMIASQPEDLSIRSQIKKWMDSPLEEGSDLSVRAAIKDMDPNAGRKIKRQLPELVLNFEVRTNSPMTPANTYNGSAYLPKIEYAPGVNEIVRPQPTFWDFLKKGSTGAAAYVWVNKKNPLGAAGFIGPGVLKPGISFEIATEISNAKKIAASEKVAMELLQDIDGFSSWVEMELTYQVMQKASLTLMNGVSSTTVPAGIQTLSVTYSLTTVKTTNPNNWDAIRACVAQLRSGNLVGDVITFVNPIDYANMVMTKAQNQGQLFIPPVTGSTIVEDNNIPIGYFQCAILQYYKILIYKGFSITYGWENDDFTKNLVTVLGEMRIHQIFSENYTGAFIYDTFANVIAALQPAP